jgi:nucleoside-diphosphate-sugar epimerase
LPSNQSPLGALPARFRRERVLIVGCGDIGLRVAHLLGPGCKVMALTSSPARVAALRSHGLVPLVGDLDRRSTLARLGGLATHLIHLAPPRSEGDAQWWRDLRTSALLQTLRRRRAPRSVVYASTSGVYGDCAGARVDETRTVRPQTPRAQRRADAERAVRHFGRATGARASVLRVPGIYALDREGGTPRERLRKGTPVLQADDDVYTNHIHADDLARSAVSALWRGKPQRAYNVCDDSELKMGDYFDLAADVFGLPRPARIARNTAQDQLPLMLLSFMSESRRLRNTRMKKELRVQLRYRTAADGLRVAATIK